MSAFLCVLNSSFVLTQYNLMTILSLYHNCIVWHSNNAAVTGMNLSQTKQYEASCVQILNKLIRNVSIINKCDAKTLFSFVLKKREKNITACDEDQQCKLCKAERVGWGVRVRFSIINTGVTIAIDIMG